MEETIKAIEERILMLEENYKEAVNNVIEAVNNAHNSRIGITKYSEEVSVINAKISAYKDSLMILRYYNEK